MGKIIFNNQELNNLQNVKYSSTADGITNADVNAIDVKYNVSGYEVTERVWTKPFTLNYSYDPASIQSVYVALGEDISGFDEYQQIASGATVHYGDHLIISVTPKTNFSANSYSDYVEIDSASSANLNGGQPYSGYRTGVSAPFCTGKYPSYVGGSMPSSLEIYLANYNSDTVSVELVSCDAIIRIIGISDQHIDISPLVSLPNISPNSSGTVKFNLGSIAMFKLMYAEATLRFRIGNITSSTCTVYFKKY